MFSKTAMAGRDLTVGILRDYEYPDLHRQTPGSLGRWQNVQFLIDTVPAACDLLIILNRIRRKVEVACKEVWVIHQEPPVFIFPWIFEGSDTFSKCFSPGGLSDSSRELSHGALPWHVDMAYDELKRLSPPGKTKKLSWITSNKGIFSRYRKRMGFLKRLKHAGVEFDLYGRGFNPIVDKYEGLGPYRYSIAFENYSGPHYWTEKVADCFLSWTMPIYYGCTNLGNYFPHESFVQIDPYDPMVITHIRNVIESDLYLRSREAIADARRMILDKYQIFPFIAERAQEYELTRGAKAELRPRTLMPVWESRKKRLYGSLRRLYEYSWATRRGPIA